MLVNFLNHMFSVNKWIAQTMKRLFSFYAFNSALRKSALNMSKFKKMLTKKAGLFFPLAGSADDTEEVNSLVIGHYYRKLLNISHLS